MSRRGDLEQFYSLLDKLDARTAGPRRLSNCTGRMPWPGRGVYFFMEPGEVRSGSGTGPRVVRVGTHALIAGSGTTLWRRLYQHRGPARPGGGNHRGSVFRLIVGTALVGRGRFDCPTWGEGQTAPRDVRDREFELERVVSKAIGEMPLLWLGIGDAPGPDSLRGYIESHAIALLSHYGKPTIDPPSRSWLGHHCDRAKVRESGLWNSEHVDERYDPGFLDTFANLVEQVEEPE